ncbi:hypothetical protein CRL705_195 [Latilactobacillus curvatus CRL 705]|nr:hypothetical protein CRL705_195 [Latilactobacillus curvatus CRL 705]
MAKQMAKLFVWLIRLNAGTWFEKHVLKSTFPQKKSVANQATDAVFSKRLALVS